MPYNVNHLHIKSLDPEKSAKWWVRAFNFKITDHKVRENGDLFYWCESENGIPIYISGPRKDQILPKGDSGVKQGIEHFGVDVEDLDDELERLKKLGATLLEGPVGGSDGGKACWIGCPDDVRVELIQFAKK